jgi:phage-related protein
MPDRAFIVDSVDLSTHGFAVERVGHRDGPRPKYTAKPVPGRRGEIALSDTPTYQGRVLTVSGTIDSTSLTDAWTKLDLIKYRLSGPGLRTVQYSDNESRYFFGYWIDGRVQSHRPELWATWWRASFRLWCPDARGFGAASTVTCSTAGAAVPMGSAPIKPVLRMDGPLTSRTVTANYQTSTGGAVETFSVSGVTLSSTEYVDIDCENQTVLTSTGGNLIANWLSTVGPFIELDPRDGDYPNSSWPKVVSGTTGASIKVRYRRAYW